MTSDKIVYLHAKEIQQRVRNIALPNSLNRPACRQDFLRAFEPSVTVVGTLSDTTLRFGKMCCIDAGFRWGGGTVTASDSPATSCATITTVLPFQRDKSIVMTRRATTLVALVAVLMPMVTIIIL